jgi:hypothetical protein
MPKAARELTRSSSPDNASRRSVIGAVAVLPTLSIAGAAKAPVPPNPDALLIALGVSLRAKHAERDGILGPYNTATGFVRVSPGDEARLTTLREESDALEAEIATIPATTLEGYAAKAVALLDDIDLMEDGRPFEGHALRYSLLQDLLRAVGA